MRDYNSLQDGKATYLFDNLEEGKANTARQARAKQKVKSSELLGESINIVKHCRNIEKHNITY
jgi:hypothetical protein